MRILVPFKRVPDPGSVSDWVGNSDVKWIVNPFDEIAIEEALRMKERGEAEMVTAVTIAPAAAEEQARAAFAMGVDRVIRIEDQRQLDPYSLSRILAGVVLREQLDLVIMGKQAIDDDASQTGQMLAAVLKWPQATFVSKIELLVDSKKLKCTRETDRGLEEIEVELPAVVTTDLRLNEPRYVSLPGLMKAKRRTIDVVTPEQLGVKVVPKTKILRVKPVPRRSSGQRVESVEELLNHLRGREKVI